MILNQQAFENAKNLIQQGKKIKSNHWTPPTTEQENEYIDTHSMQAYAQWFLGIREEDNPSTKQAYAFPFTNDFSHVDLEGIRAIITRAGQYHYSDIEQAAIELKKLAE